MKNLLLTTTAMVMTAGVAAADITMSGYARSGLDNTSNEGTQVVSRMRIQLDASVTTDSGIGFNARQRIETEENGSNRGVNGMRFGITMGGLAVNLGNINGAVESIPGLYSGSVGLEGNGYHNNAANVQNYWNWTAYTSKGAGARDGIELTYSMGGVGIHLHSATDTYTESTATVDAKRSKEMGIGLNYTMGGITLAAARQTRSNDSTRVNTDGVQIAGAEEQITVVTAGFDIAEFGVGLSHAIYNSGLANAKDSTKTVLSASYDLSDATSITGFAGQQSVNDENGSVFGIGANVGLGGGASFIAGYSRSAAEDNNTQMSAGFQFSF